MKRRGLPQDRTFIEQIEGHISQQRTLYKPRTTNQNLTSLVGQPVIQTSALAHDLIRWRRGSARRIASLAQCPDNAASDRSVGWRISAAIGPLSSRY